jgi:hypothetical protein
VSNCSQQTLGLTVAVSWCFLLLVACLEPLLPPASQSLCFAKRVTPP